MLMNNKPCAVLDHGYVRLVEVLGNDLMVVNAARVSYGKRHTALTAGDVRLLAYLWQHQHLSPFYHPKLQFEIRAPLFVTRQWQRHIVDSVHTSEGVALNEESRRYTQEDLEFYVPELWRGPHPTNKQASVEAPVEHAWWRGLLKETVQEGVTRYRDALAAGVAPEQARLFLPANAQYTTWLWTASLYAVLHFIQLRRGEGAQWEMTAYAEAIAACVRTVFPETCAVAAV